MRKTLPVTIWLTDRGQAFQAAACTTVLLLVNTLLALVALGQASGRAALRVEIPLRHSRARVRWRDTQRSASSGKGLRTFARRQGAEASASTASTSRSAEESTLVEPFAPHPAGDLVVALAGVARRACGHHVVRIV